MGLCSRTRSPFLKVPLEGPNFTTNLASTPSTTNNQKQVEPRTALPLYSIGFSVLISLCLALINIGSTTAFNALVSLTIAAFYSSYTISAGVLLHKRLTTSTEDIIWGPFQMGRWGVLVIVASIVYSAIGIFFSFWPGSVQVTAMTMNWSILVFGAVLVFSMIYWGVWGRNVYTGPIRDVGFEWGWRD